LVHASREYRAASGQQPDGNVLTADRDALRGIAENGSGESLGEGKTMKLNKLIAIPAIVLAAGISLTACGSTPARPNARPMPFITHTVTVTPKPQISGRYARDLR
jgi:hypothetical protein